VQVKTKNLAVGILVTLLVVVLWYRVAYSPAKSSAAKAKEQTEQTKASVKTVQHELDSNAAKQKKSAAAVSSKKLDAAVPVNDKITTFLRRTDALAVSSGVNYQSVTPTESGPASGLSVINVGMTVDGSYDSVMKYVSSLLSDSRIMLVDTVAVTAGGGDNASTTGGGPTGKIFAGTGAPPNLQVTISGRLFAQPDAASVLTPDATAGAPAGGPAPGTVQNS
jgi:Tfp pilus assembly protein PilO